MTEREPYSRSQARRLAIQTGTADDATRIAAALEGLLPRQNAIHIYHHGNGRYEVADKLFEPGEFGDTLVAALESALHAKTAGETGSSG
jgi:hypothetical protein